MKITMPTLNKTNVLLAAVTIVAAAASYWFDPLFCALPLLGFTTFASSGSNWGSGKTPSNWQTSNLKASGGDYLFTGSFNPKFSIGGTAYNHQYSPNSPQNMQVAQMQRDYNNYAKQYAARQSLNNYFEREAAVQRKQDDLTKRAQAAQRWRWENDKANWAKQDRGLMMEDRAIAQRDREEARAERLRDNQEREEERSWAREQRAWQREVWERARNVLSSSGGGAGGGSVSVGGSYGVTQS